jgi:dsDNA-specific endonuclease/ATPase MutS2
MTDSSRENPRRSSPEPPADPKGGRPGPSPLSDREQTAPLPDPTTDQAGAIPIPDGDQVIAIPIEDALDLHSFAPKDVAGVVADYLEECAQRGLHEVRLIHGRGTGAQRALVRSLLRRLPLVAGFEDAPPERGGWGATIVFLRRDPPVR